MKTNSNIEFKSTLLSTINLNKINKACGEKQRGGKVYNIKNKRSKTMSKLTIALSFLLITLLLVGCSNEIINPQVTEDDFLKQQVLESDEIADFLASTDVTLDDELERNFEYDDYGFLKTAEPIIPLRWGRKIENINKSLTVIRESDSVAIVLVTKRITGNLIIKAIKNNDTTKVVKPFIETTNRKVRFVRIGRDTDVRKNWKPVAITVVEGKTATKDFNFTKLEIITPNDTLQISNPLSYWMLLNPVRGGVVNIPPGTTLTVRLTLNSENGDPEYAMLRHSTDHKNKHRVRTKMNLISTTGVPGNYIRIYEKSFTSRLPQIMMVGRFNLIVDVMSYNSLNDDTAPYMDMFWGMPYITKRF